LGSPLSHRSASISTGYTARAGVAAGRVATSRVATSRLATRRVTTSRVTTSVDPRPTLQNQIQRRHRPPPNLGRASTHRNRDEARNTYIQWDPELEQWMEWGESQGKWIPISQ